MLSYCVNGVLFINWLFNLVSIYTFFTELYSEGSYLFLLINGVCLIYFLHLIGSKYIVSLRNNYFVHTIEAIFMALITPIQVVVGNRQSAQFTYASNTRKILLQTFSDIEYFRRWNLFVLVRWIIFVCFYYKDYKFDHLIGFQHLLVSDTLNALMCGVFSVWSIHYILSVLIVCFITCDFIANFILGQYNTAVITFGLILLLETLYNHTCSLWRTPLQSFAGLNKYKDLLKDFLIGIIMAFMVPTIYWAESILLWRSDWFFSDISNYTYVWALLAPQENLRYWLHIPRLMERAKYLEIIFKNEIHTSCTKDAASEICILAHQASIKEYNLEKLLIHTKRFKCTLHTFLCAELSLAALYWPYYITVTYVPTAWTENFFFTLYKFCVGVGCICMPLCFNMLRCIYYTRYIENINNVFVLAHQKHTHIREVLSTVMEYITYREKLLPFLVKHLPKAIINLIMEYELVSENIPIEKCPYFDDDTK